MTSLLKLKCNLKSVLSPLLVTMGVIGLSVPSMATTSYACSSTSGSPTCSAVTNPFLYQEGNGASFNGLFSSDQDIQLFQVVVTDGTPTLGAVSYGYGGGTDLNGATVTPGGFATELAIFNSAGTMLANSNVSSCPVLGQQFNTTTNLCYDAATSVVVSAGTYYVALTENDNYGLNSPGLFSSGTTINPAAFNENGNGNFTTSYCFPSLASPCTATAFYDPFGDSMTGNYYINLDVTTPEPASFVLVSTALMAGLFLVWRRRKASQA
jgi:hypothetical protein